MVCALLDVSVSFFSPGWDGCRLGQVCVLDLAGNPQATSAAPWCCWMAGCRSLRPIGVHKQVLLAAFALLVGCPELMVESAAVAFLSMSFHAH